MKTRGSRPRRQVSELTLIETIRSRAGHAAGRSHAQPSSDLRVGIGDDCAVLRTRPSEEIVVTTDLSIELVHFRRDWHTPESIGHRCLARGLSDVAAMGARPVAAFVSIALPAELTAKSTRGTPSWLTRFYEGLLKLAAEHSVPLAGGDLAQVSELVTADIVVIGAVSRGKALLRSGATSGDAIYVTGALGGAAAELLALQRAPQRRAQQATTRGKAEAHPHLFPQPRVAVGRELVRRRLASAAIDISDGLSTDLHHLCKESGLAAEIDAAALPIHIMARLADCAGLAESALELALHAGEDYELLFTVAPTARMPADIGGVPIHRIGVMRPPRRNSPPITLKSDNKSTALKAKGWEHFQAGR